MDTFNAAPEFAYLPRLMRLALALALALGLFVGLERERRGKEAGLRTFGFAALLGCLKRDKSNDGARIPAASGSTQPQSHTGDSTSWKVAGDEPGAAGRSHADARYAEQAEPVQVW